jgi:hypothetical protein
MLMSKLPHQLRLFKLIETILGQSDIVASMPSRISAPVHLEAAARPRGRANGSIAF